MAKKKKGLVLNLNKKNKKKKKEDENKTAKRGGVVISQKSAQKKRAAKKANESLKKAVNLQKEEKYKSKETNKYKAAIDTAQHTSALGTKVEKKTGTVKVKGKDGKTEKVKYEYEPMTMQDYGKMEVGARTGRLKETLNSDKKLKKKVTDLNVKDYAESPGVMGALDQMTMGLSVSEDPTYEYSKSQKKIMDSQKQTGKYTAGRVVGGIAEFGLGGVGTIGSSIAKTGGKAVLKEAGKQGGKALAKQTAKNIAKETAGDVVASAGLNILDAVKFSYKDGKIDKKTFAKELALNVGGDIVIGGAVSGLMHGIPAGQIAKFNRITKQKAKGEAISKADQKFYDKNLDEITNKVQDRLRQLKEEDAKKTKPVDNSMENPVKQVAKATDEATVKAEQPQTEQPTVSKTESVEQPKTLEEIDDRVTQLNEEIRAFDEDWHGNDSQHRWDYDGVNDRFTRVTGETRDVTLEEYKRLKAIRDAKQTEIDQLLENIEIVDGKPRLKTVEEPTVAKSATTEQPNVGKATDEATNPTTAKTDVGDVDPNWKAASEEAYNNPGKQFDSADEKIRYDNPTPEEFKARVQKADRTSEVSEAYTNIKDAYFTSKQLEEMAAVNEAEGMFNKVGGTTQAEARTLAEAELSKKGVNRMAEDFVNNELPTDGHITAARAEVILREMTEAVEKGEVNTDLYFQVVEKAAIEFASTAGRNLNAVKMMYRATPEGRVRVIEKQLAQLSKEYSSRLKGKALELTDEQRDLIRKAKTEEELAEVAKKITIQAWDQIPSSFVEKLNMVRKINMLFNVKTNLRNLGGNMTLRGARNISDYVEYLLTTKTFAKTLEKNNANSIMNTRVTREEIANARKYIHEEIFEANYKKSNSKGRYIERRRPDGSTVLTSKIGSSLEKATFATLEAGDVYPTLRPAYTKSYLRWCKHKGIDISNIDNLKNMSAKDKAMANSYAMHQAEVASFRDATNLANKLNELKLKMESGQGKTAAGTVGLRVGNMALESVLPFVKTPINVFRRSVDYSPISLVRAINDLATFKARGDNDALLNGIHHLATGLTGTGVTLLGVGLARFEILGIDIMAKAGEKSGDAFYDRDMGYQDYSLIVGDKSMTIDWMSPLQTSLFMGAQAVNILENDEKNTGMDYFNALLTLFEPHLEASFMSSAKDMFEMFAETAVGDGNGKSNWGEAILTTLGGTIPQNYLNSILNPQLASQSAQALDKYQRDTRSTSDKPLEKSWESWRRKVINRYPVLRNVKLNPKLDSRGQNVKTQGDNILTRMFHAFVNPSNVKNIRFDELDKEIIKTYNDMEEGDDKNYFFYKFTGNPNYDLGDGKRMTYDEAYKYGKESRQQQTNMLKNMINSVRYKTMTTDMKVKEIKDSHDIGNVYADRKTYGHRFAADRIAESSETDGKARDRLNKLGGNDKTFVDFYLKKEKLMAQTHDSSDETKAIAVAKFGDKLVSKAYKIGGEKLKTAETYFKNGGSIKEYTNTVCEIISIIKNAGVSDKKQNKAVAAARSKVNTRTYSAMGLSEQQANMGAGLKKFGYTFEALETMEAEALLNFDSDDNNSLKKDEIIDYIESLGLDSNEKKACIFAYFSDAKNPYGSIPNYLGLGDSGSSSGGGSGGGGKGKKSNLPSWEDWVKDYLKNDTYSYESVEFKDWDSPIDSAYRKKITSLNTK